MCYGCSNIRIMYVHTCKVHVFITKFYQHIWFQRCSSAMEKVGYWQEFDLPVFPLSTLSLEISCAPFQISATTMANWLTAVQNKSLKETNVSCNTRMTTPTCRPLRGQRLRPCAPPSRKTLPPLWDSEYPGLYTLS